MEPDWLFLRLIDGIAAASVSSDTYVILRASGELRLLLLEGLLNRVNRERRLEIRFRVCDVMNSAYTQLILSDNPSFYSAVDALDPEMEVPPGLQSDPAVLPLDRFLALPVVKVQDRFATIRDIITYAANVSGGVHLGEPRAAEAGHQALHSVQDIGIGGGRIQVVQLRSILKVVANSLRQLVDRVRADHV